MDGGAYPSATAPPRAPGFVPIAAEPGMRANNGPRERLASPVWIFPPPPPFARVFSSEKNNLSNHFYSALEEEEEGW